MSPEEQKCDGCGESASSFQCPLCQAEIVTDRGFFCTQECFAKNWLQHRSTFHKSGVVRAKQQPESNTSNEVNGSSRKRSNTDEKSTDKALKKKRKVTNEVKVEEEKEKVKTYPIIPWSPLPPFQSNETQIVPEILPGIPRIIIGAASSTDHRINFWSAAVAAAHHIVAEFKNQDIHSNPLNVLIITSGPLETHAMAWAARCAGLSNFLQLVVNSSEEDLEEENPSKYFSGQRRIVITTQEIVRRVADGSASFWLPRSSGLLITLPGVSNATDFQTINTRALFFSYRCEGFSQIDEAWSSEEEIKHYVKPLKNSPVELHSFFEFNSINPTTSSTTAITTTTSSSLVPINDETISNEKPKIIHFDNDVSTSLARGDLQGALQHLVRLYSTRRGIFEEILTNSFLSSLGTISLLHFHHTLAYSARYLVDHSSRFTGPQGGTLKDMSLRVISKIIRLIPPITEIEESFNNIDIKENKSTIILKDSLIPEPSPMEKEKFFNYYEKLPNLQLQATICYLFDHASSNIIDSFGIAWGIKKVLKGPESLKRADQRRQDAVKRLQNRYGTKIGPSFANYLIILMHFLYDAVACYSLSLEEIEHRTLWSLTIAEEVDPLPKFLSNCFLLQKEEASLVVEDKKKNNKTPSIPTLSSRQVVKPKKVSRTTLLRTFPVRTKTSEEETISLSWVKLPLTGQRQREIEKLHKQAVEEILMAMPQKPRPMYIGDVGNLIGKWFHFNARFDGTLGVNLNEFLMQHSEAFRVVGNLVTRRTAGVTEQIKMRFNDDDAEDGDDGEDSDKERKAKDRRMLTGASAGGGTGGKDIPARARKKALVKAFNKSRFNRNYKPIDPSAKVPGYVKHAPRRVKGRGRKVNKRNTKRG